MTRPRRARPARRPGRERRPPGVAWLALGVAAAAALLYLPSLGNGFARDDADLIPAIARWARGLPALLANDFWSPTGSASGLWRPVVTFSLWLDARLGGGAPAAYHLANLLAHAGASALLVALLARAGLPRVAVALAGLWFATLPSHAEAVAWVVGRTDVLCAFWALAALALDARAWTGRGRAAGAAGAASLAAFALALLSKEAAAGLVLVLAARAWAEGAAPPSWGRMARRLGPALAITVAWLGLHAWVARPGGLPMTVDPGEPARWPLAGWAMLPRFAAFLWPLGAHAPDAAPTLPAGPLAAPVLLGALATLAVAATIVVLARRRSRALEPAMLAVAPLLPALALAWGGAALAFGERMMVLPAAGVAWLAAIGLARLGPGAARAAAFGGMTALILANAAVTWRVQAAWRDDESLYRAMTSGSPGYAVGWIGLADLRARQGARAEAESLLARAESLGPRIPALHLARAALHYRHGEWSAVIEAADRGLALQPALADARLLRAIALTRLRRLDEAAAESARLLAERPDDPAVLALDGQRLLLAGDPAGAVARLEAATRGAPGDVAAWYALGIARALTGAAAGARAAFERTVALDPAYYDGWLQLARACAGLGDAAAARAAAARAGALPEARDGRAAALAAALSGAAPSP